MVVSVISISVSSQNNSVPDWKPEWSYRQEIHLPIVTNVSYAKYQPIDIRVTFENPCWTKNENETSIRVCLWNGIKWFELDSQIYDLTYTDPNYIIECCLVFLVPEFADGNELYYVYYDNIKKPSPNYQDHVSVEDLYYSRPIIAGIKAEAKYYGIKEDGYYVYGVGQEGSLLDRSFSQIVVKQKERREEIDILDSDQIVSFAFSYYYGNEEQDESSSDQIFVSKEILIDGNLMVEFGIKSESRKKDIVTTAIYKYYFSPAGGKRLCVRVKHEMLEDAVVQGLENIDGRFGMMASFKSRNPAIKKLNVGDIYPYLHFSDENNQIKEYIMNLNPESKNREWIISYRDDADLGSEGWIAYGNGNQGKVVSIIFSSTEDIIKSGRDERDGIQVKVAEKEYFDFLTTEVDYASINFGRNSYEKGYGHDLVIPEGLVVEYDAELFTSEEGGYSTIQKEAKMYQELIKHRYSSKDTIFDKEEKLYSLTVITYFGGTRFTYPWLSNRSHIHLPVMWIEVHQDDNCIASGIAEKTLFNRYRAQIIFSEISKGEYFVKVFWKLDNSTMFFNGARKIVLDDDKKIHIFCSWERRINVMVSDQKNQGVEGVNTILLKIDGLRFDSNITDRNGLTLLKAPYKHGDPYILKAFYKGILIYENYLRKSLLKLKVVIDIELNDFSVEIRDSHDLPPGVEITLLLLGLENNNNIKLMPEEMKEGTYYFKNIPSGKYKLQITYGNFIDEKVIHLPKDGNSISIPFSAKFDLVIDLFDLRANPLTNEDVNFKILRKGMQTFESGKKIFSMPPAHYTIKAYHDEEVVGIKQVELTSNRNVKLVTKLRSLYPLIIFGSTICFIGIVIVFIYMKILSFYDLLTFLAIAFIILTLIQPWWELSASSSNPLAERSAQLLINPQVMIESTTYNKKTMYDIAEMPEIFIDFLGKVVIIIYTISILLGLSFISLKLKKRKYFFLLYSLSILLMITIVSMFFFGISKVTEASIGPVQGDGILSITLEETVTMQANWGFSSGFYLIIIAVIIIFISLLLEIKKRIKKGT
jgi:hypothetical protein